MPASKIKITNNQEDQTHQQSPSWLVAFVRYPEPCAMQIGDKTKAFVAKDIFIVENDCVAVNTSAPKGGFAKTASLTMKNGEIWYQNAINSGDFCFIWMAQDQDHIDQIVAGLKKINAGGKSTFALNDYKSGLKFFGRVRNLSNSNSRSGQGQFSISQTIQCQAFLELANSVYYTYASEVLKATAGKGDAGTLSVLNREFAAFTGKQAIESPSSPRAVKKQSIIDRYGKIENLKWANEDTWIDFFTLPSDLNVFVEKDALNKSIYTDSLGYEVSTGKCTSFKLNKDIFPQMNAAIDNLRKAGKLSEWTEIRATQSIRYATEKPNSISTHSYGLAIDINPSTNKYNKKPSLSPEFVKAFTDAGWTWGGYFSIKDGMHFSLAWEGFSGKDEDDTVLNDQTAAAVDETPVNKSATSTNTKNGLDVSMSNLAEKFLEMSEVARSPEQVIGTLFMLLMGIESDKSIANMATDLPIKGKYGDSIGIPKQVASILGKPSATRLYQLYNVFLGLQKYTRAVKSPKETPWLVLAPTFSKDSESLLNQVFYSTGIATKGLIPYAVPPVWDNNSAWNIMSQFLNPIVNEMYTALRVNKENKIVPTLIVREQPFSTDLYNFLLEKAPLFDKTVQVNEEGKNKLIVSTTEEENVTLSEIKAREVKYLADLKERTFYAELPRWEIDASMVKGFNLDVSEDNRINFIQVWATPKGAEYVLGNNQNPQSFIQAQLQLKNFVADEIDISRHGLRADIQSTEFDSTVAGDNKSIAGIASRMRADWLFNGHLKPSGSIVLNGVQEPICEGDNLLFRGVLFHIDAVNHSCSISGGVRTFITTLSVRNGIIAKSLDSGIINKRIPQYTNAFGNYKEDVAPKLGLPPSTDIQNTGDDKNRMPDGELNVPKFEARKNKK